MGVGTIAQVRAERGAGVDRRANLRRIGRGMTDGDAHAAGDELGDERRGTVELGRQRDETNLPLGGFGQANANSSDIGRAAVDRRDGRPRTVFGRNVGPFQMNARRPARRIRAIGGRPAGWSPARPTAPRGWRW